MFDYVRQSNINNSIDSAIEKFDWYRLDVVVTLLSFFVFLARSKATGGPRKALANIQNTHHSKTVTFDGTALKPTSKISQLKNIRTITPVSKQTKKVGDRPTSNRKGLSSTTPFKIFEDGQIEQNQSKKAGTQTATKSRKKIDIYNDEIEYMPPCTDRGKCF